MESKRKTRLSCGRFMSTYDQSSGMICKPPTLSSEKSGDSNAIEFAERYTCSHTNRLHTNLWRVTASPARLAGNLQGKVNLNLREQFVHVCSGRWAGQGSFGRLLYTVIASGSNLLRSTVMPNPAPSSAPIPNLIRVNHVLSALLVFANSHKVSYEREIV